MANFKQQYARLNPAQARAVDTIEGPVMVIAGAGTGKTQTIALRIANILNQTQTPPQNILALTFTDSAAANMRSRLLDIIGPTAYRVKVHTFHSFCNEIILTHPDYFNLSSQAKSLDELSRLEIIQSLLIKLPPNSPLSPWGDPFYYQKQIISSIQTLKRENISPLALKKLIARQQTFIAKSQKSYQQLKLLRVNSQLDSQVSSLATKLASLSPPGLKSLLNTQISLFKAGHFDLGRAKNPPINFKNALLKTIDDIISQIPRQLALQSLYSRYRQTLRRQSLYDFDDMILFVIKAFKNNPQLLSQIQENYLYFLVDEYQDTNSAQNQILTLLAPASSSPNIFVVGDDDQSIFRFQGAALENLFDFYQTYQPRLVVLINNYRSHQLILDGSLSLISHNQNRLANVIKGVDKALVAQIKYDPDPINLISAPSPIEENYLLANTIKTLLDSGVPADQIAVLFRANADPQPLVPFLDAFHIQYQTSSTDNVLSHPLIVQIINLLKFINDPSGDQLLFSLLASDLVGLKPLTLLKFNRQAHTGHRSLFELCSKARQTKIKKFFSHLASAQICFATLTFDQAFNRLLRRFSILDRLLAKDQIQSLTALNSFYAFFSQSQADIKLTDLIAKIDLLVQNDISLSTSTPTSPAAINLLTVHKAKGLEFDHVFIINAIDQKWGNNRVYSNLKLPYGILKTQSLSLTADPNEEERRLFYVALTRAKKQIYISYSQTSPTSRPQLPSVFISEINPRLIQKVPLPPKLKPQALQKRFLSTPLPLSTANTRAYLQDYLTNHYRFNVSHLNSYLRCPLCFYYKTILRIPAVKTKYQALGTAVHYALKKFYQSQISTPKKFMSVFNLALTAQNLPPDQFDQALSIAQANLPDYFTKYFSSIPKNCLTEYDFSNSQIFLDHIPLTGKIDRIQPLPTRPQALVVDYKTGQPDNKSLGPDSDYFRQLVFYKILSDLSPHFPYTVTTGQIDFIQKNKQGQFTQKQLLFTPAHIARVKTLIKDTYQQIMAQKFNIIGQSCRDPDHLHHLFSK